jgi:hypothetical protein
MTWRISAAPEYPFGMQPTQLDDHVAQHRNKPRQLEARVRLFLKRHDVLRAP